jgi:hypothetical protein
MDAAKCLEKAVITHTNLQEDPDAIRAAFDALVSGAHKLVKESADREESKILS